MSQFECFRVSIFVRGIKNYTFPGQHQDHECFSILWVAPDTEHSSACQVSVLSDMWWPGAQQYCSPGLCWWYSLLWFCVSMIREKILLFSLINSTSWFGLCSSVLSYSDLFISLTMNSPILLYRFCLTACRPLTVLLIMIMSFMIS